MKDELKVSGLNAAKALAEKRREDVVRVFLTEERIRDFSELLRWCASERKVYRVVPEGEIEKVSATVHHEGVCIVARTRPPATLRDLLERIGDAAAPQVVVFLENVQNPHNLGAIARVAAHFGARAIVVVGEGPGWSIPGAAYRTAEGGLEHVEVAVARDPVAALSELRQSGFRAIALSSHVKKSIYQVPVPQRVALLFGAEAEGLSQPVLRAADEVVAIPGTGAVESLNVSTAASAALAEIRRGQESAARGSRPRKEPRRRAR